MEHPLVREHPSEELHCTEHIENLFGALPAKELGDLLVCGPVLLHHCSVDKLDGQIIGSGIDIMLNQGGYDSAMQIAEEFTKHTVDIVVASTLVRSRDTATPIAHATDAMLLLDERLNAQHFGALEGETIDELDVHPVLSQHLYKNLDFEDFYDSQAPGGESLREVEERATQALDELIIKSGEDIRIAVVTHGSVIDVLLGQHLGLPAAEWSGLNKYLKCSYLGWSNTHGIIKSLT